MASFCNIIVTFPVHKLMFRQQTEALTAVKAFRAMRAEGLPFLYRGVGPPLMQKSVSMSIMFGCYDFYKAACLRSGFIENEFVAKNIAAILAGSTEALLAPLERIQALLQTPYYHNKFENTWDAARKLRVHGLKEFYRGTVPVLLRNGPANALFFTLREPLRDAMPRNDSRVWDFFADFIGGAVLGASISTLFFPINAAKNMMQSKVGGRFDGVVRTLARMYKERGGVRGLYYGVHVNFTRSLMSWGIINATYELSKRYIF